MLKEVPRRGSLIVVDEECLLEKVVRLGRNVVRDRWAHGGADLGEREANH